MEITSIILIIFKLNILYYTFTNRITLKLEFISHCKLTLRPIIAKTLDTLGNSLGLQLKVGQTSSDIYNVNLANNIILFIYFQ